MSDCMFECVGRLLLRMERPFRFDKTPSESMTANCVSLMKSEFGKHGVIYTEMEWYNMDLFKSKAERELDEIIHRLEMNMANN